MTDQTNINHGIEVEIISLFFGGAIVEVFQGVNGEILFSNTGFEYIFDLDIASLAYRNDPTYTWRGLELHYFTLHDIVEMYNSCIIKKPHHAVSARAYNFIDGLFNEFLTAMMHQSARQQIDWQTLKDDMKAIQDDRL